MDINDILNLGKMSVAEPLAAPSLSLEIMMARSAAISTFAEPAKLTPPPKTDKKLQSRIRIAGTSYYRQIVAELAKKYNQNLTAAQVVAEPTNLSDPEAKAVYIDGQLVGYIPKEKVGLFPEGTYTASFCNYQTRSMKSVEKTVQFHFARE